jgi:hypothetical protein
VPITSYFLLLTYYLLLRPASRAGDSSRQIAGPTGGPIAYCLLPDAYYIPSPRFPQAFPENPFFPGGLRRRPKILQKRKKNFLFYANYYYFCGTEKEEKLLFLYLKV